MKKYYYEFNLVFYQLKKPEIGEIVFIILILIEIKIDLL